MKITTTINCNDYKVTTGLKTNLLINHLHQLNT